MVDAGTLMAHVRALASGIGPRPATSEAERRAHEYAAGVLSGAGARVSTEPFRSWRTFTWPWLLVALLAAGAGVLLWFPGPVTRWVAAGLGWAGLVLFWGMASGNIALGRLFPHGESRNVVGVVAPAGPVRHRVVLLAHADSTRAALMWHPAQVRRFGASQRLNLFLTALLAVVSLAAALFPGALPWAWLGLPSLLAMVYGVVMLVHRETFCTWVQGANDNASGVAVALALAEQFSADRLSGTELWCVVTGCEEVGAPVGAQAFVRAHGAELAGADWLIIDTVGTGSPRLLSGEGYPRFYPAAPHLLAAAQSIARAQPHLEVSVSRPFPTQYTDALPVLARGWAGLAIWCEQDGVLPNWHWPTDTVERVNPESLRNAFALCQTLIAGLDASSQRRPPAG